VCRIEKLIVLSEPVEELREIALGQRVQRVTGLVEKQDATGMKVLAFDQEHQVEAEEPLKARATALEFNLLRAAIIGYPDAEVISVRLESKAVIPLLPPLAELLGKPSRCRLEQDISLLFLLRSLLDLRLGRLLALRMDVLTQRQDLAGLEYTRRNSSVAFRDKCCAIG
jgi:hypothetical protein